jgi:uncharacterized membrane protein
MWLFIGLFFGAAVIFAWAMLKNRGITVTWYEWLLAIIGLALIFFTIQNYFASLEEFWPIAANWFLLIAGLPGLIFLALAGTLIMRHSKKVEKAA